MQIDKIGRAVREVWQTTQHRMQPVDVVRSSFGQPLDGLSETQSAASSSVVVAKMGDSFLVHMSFEPDAGGRAETQGRWPSLYRCPPPSLMQTAARKRRRWPKSSLYRCRPNLLRAAARRPLGDAVGCVFERCCGQGSRIVPCTYVVRI